jgi:hypothetical protein
MVNSLELTEIPEYVRDIQIPMGSFGQQVKFIDNDSFEIEFYPLNQPIHKRYQYTHRYLNKYELEDEESNRDCARIAYPNQFYTKRFAKARVLLKNNSVNSLHFDLQMFYQNTSYWYPTHGAMDAQDEEWFRTNYFGSSDLTKVIVEPDEEKEIFLEYIIGEDPKGDAELKSMSYGGARPGSYEFMLWAKPQKQDWKIWEDSLVLWKVNPFAELQRELIQGDSTIWNQGVAYIPPGHFRFKLLNERFDGANILEPGWVYDLADRNHKPLCDTCEYHYIWNKDIIVDQWKAEEFFEGYIHKASRINGIFLRIPRSNNVEKQKTWGEFKFFPEFKYGKFSVVAKLAPVRNESGTPTGIIHNIWLYQKRHRRADTIPEHPYNYLMNSRGNQPYEIDIEIWSKIYKEPWKNVAYANYSIVDYMRDANVKVKPGERLETERFGVIDRHNSFQLNLPNYEELTPDFFEAYHLFEIEWHPQVVRFYIDKQLKAEISNEWAKIPDQPCHAWVNSPIYQDGTYYTQSNIPFTSNDHFTHIRYMSIE